MAQTIRLNVHSKDFFLDDMVDIQGEQILTLLYAKPTDKNSILLVLSFHPIQYVQWKAGWN